MESNIFIADLHVHSKFSRATARNLDIENLYVWSQLKGIEVVGTGDFTHPEWFAEITEKLEPAEAGLFRLKQEIARHCDQRIPPACRGRVRFMLSCEISNIYKKRESTRKNHNLVFFPDLEMVRRFNARLDAIGNINSDGRPILGLDARDLLEIVLEVSEDGFLVPAHIWTPWFSMLGSKSGFDSLEACFGDLSSYIFAAETGLSSDPAMNWRVADLDELTLISNSDAHSPSKLGREANLFKTKMNYFAMRSALQSGDQDKFVGTFEFFPEEGKYHIDGHRRCGVCFTPEQTRTHGGYCPICGKSLTLGVLNRVESLATRPEGTRSQRAVPFYRLIPLDDLLSEILNVGSQSKKVKQTYHDILTKLGSEFQVLHFLPIEKIESVSVPLLAEAIGRMRNNLVSFSPGYDGVFGKVQLFTDQERARLMGQRDLFSGFAQKNAIPETGSEKIMGPSFIPADRTGGTALREENETVIRLNDDQQQAVSYNRSHLMIIAGPGTGKTRTLTQKIAQLIADGADVEKILAVTFTNKAAAEMNERLRVLLGDAHSLPFVGTFHALGYRIVKQSDPDTTVSIIEEKTRKALVQDVLKLNGHAPKKQPFSAETLMAWIAAAKQRLIDAHGPLERVCPREHLSVFKDCYTRYQDLLETNHLVDFEDLILTPIQLLETAAGIRDHYVGKYHHLFIDEYQDINAGQYRLVKLIAGNHAKICVIGDPDQSIYAFRGSDLSCFQWFKGDFEDVDTIFLTRNYRSTQTILDVSTQVIRHNPETFEAGVRKGVYSKVSGEATIQLVEAASPKAEAVAIGKTIEAMLGGTGFFSLDSGAADPAGTDGSMSFADFAVLFRTRNQQKMLSRVLEEAGIPCQQVDLPTVLEQPGIVAVLSLFRILKRLGTIADLSAACEAMRFSMPAGALEKLKIWTYQNRMDVEQALAQVRRLPVPHMGRSHQQRLYDYTGQLQQIRSATDELATVDVVDYLVKHGRMHEKYANDPAFESGYRRLLQAGEAHATDAGAFLAAINLSSHTDLYDLRVGRVSLMTMHAAKGLEFPVVFIAGCEHGWIPYQSPRRPTESEEERRLFYVAMTRAKRHLLLTMALRRRINGQMYDRRWSPFVEEIEDRYKQVVDGRRHRQKIYSQRQLTLF